MTRIRTLAIVATVAAGTLTVTSLAHAQSGIPNPIAPTSSAPPATPPSSSAPAPAPGGGTGMATPAPPVPMGPGGGPPTQPANVDVGGPGEGIVFGDSGLSPDREEQSLHYAGQTPDVHVVRSGDTLWDICQYYFNNPWDWPKVWSYNPAITNPHWIYPGDLVRLYPAGQGPVDAGGNGAGPTATGGGGEQGITRAESTGVRTMRGASLRQIAFVDDEELKYAGTIIGSPEEKGMLSPGDEVYVEYPEGKPPQIGQRYAVYSDAEAIKHPETKELVGAYITLHGEVRITEVKKGRKARATLTYATDVIERGMRVGPTRTQFKDVAPRPAERNLEGVIIAILTMDHLIGDHMVIFIDRGADDGLKPGNQMRVLRRGDAYQAKMGPSGNAGQDDRKYPDNEIGQIIVVEVGKRSSIAFVTRANHEIEIGDHVVMRLPR